MTLKLSSENRYQWQRYGVGAIALTLISAVAIGCDQVSNDTQAQATENTRPPQSIHCVFPFWIGFAPVHVASELGYFAAEGLEVTTSFDNDRANVLPAMERGDLDCTMRTLGEHLSRPLTDDSNSTVIGTIDISVGADGVVAAPGIDSVEDLVGKVFAGEINHPGTVMTQYALNQAGYSLDDLDIRLINTDDSSAVFEDPNVAAVATWEPMMSSIVDNTTKDGAKILLSSADFNGLITDVIIVQRDDLEANPEKYRGFLRGIYRAIEVYESDPDEFLTIAAPVFNVTPKEMAADLEGVQYTSYEDTLAFIGTPDNPGRLFQVFTDLNDINLQLDLQDAPLTYKHQINTSLVQDLFDGTTP